VAIVDNEHEGVLLTGLFNRGTKNLKSEVDAFAEQLSALQKQLGFAEYVRIVEEEGDRVKITIIPVSPTPTKAQEEAMEKGELVQTDGVEASQEKYKDLIGAQKARVDVVEVEGKEELKTGVLGILSKKK